MGLDQPFFNRSITFVIASYRNESFIRLYLITSGLAQCTELCLQLRGECGPRQVPGAKVALQHNLGLGGAVVVALYKFQKKAEAEFEKAKL